MTTADCAIEWMSRVCETETTTGMEDRGLDTVLTLLSELGATVEKQTVEPGRTNVLATWGEPKVLLSSHFDTVPPFVPYRWDGQTFWGRGTCDAKGQWIAQLLAVRELLLVGVEGLGWLGVVGEETGSEGARAAQSLGPKLKEVRLVINGEPTECHLATGQRGTSRYLLSCEGVSTHSGMPELGEHAIWMLLDWLQTLRKQDLARDDRLGEEIWNLGVIRGGTATNVIPSEAQAEIMLRWVPGSLFESALEKTRPPKGTWSLTSKTDPSFFETGQGFATTIVPYGSDAPHLARLAKSGRVILAGPGTIRVAHRADEHLSLVQLLQGVDLFRDLVVWEMK